MALYGSLDSVFWPLNMRYRYLYPQVVDRLVLGYG